MSAVDAYGIALAVLAALAVLSWIVGVAKRNVAIVDTLWSLFFLIAAAVYAVGSAPLTGRAWTVLALVAVWALRLSLYVTARNWGQPEDYRYRTIRANNEPGFAFKSLYLVFGLQALLAWIISVPLLPAIASERAFGAIDAVAAGLWAVGMLFEAGGDFQLARFKADPGNRGRVLDSGLWRYTRHPNYFGNACVWWAFWLFAVSAGAWWTLYAPVLMTFLLLKVSGVAMLEKTIGSRRAGYDEYVATTSAFIPWFPGKPRSTPS